MILTIYSYSERQQPLLLEVICNGCRLQALVDIGASHSVCDRGTLEKIGESSEETQFTATMVDGTKLPIHGKSTLQLQIGALRWKSTLPITNIKGLDFILGRDFLEQFNPEIDWVNRKAKQKKSELLQPLLVPEQPWQVVSLDFITGLPSTSRGHDAILVVINKFSKMGHFIPTNTTATAGATACLFFDRTITIHGIPATLISDRDPKFSSKLWRELMGLLGTKLAMSLAYHPQTERLNQVVEQLLRTPCKDDISHWIYRYRHLSLLITTRHMWPQGNLLSSCATHGNHLHHNSQPHRHTSKPHTTSSPPCSSYGRRLSDVSPRCKTPGSNMPIDSDESTQ
ncbi:unnamed protein product [Closterium sp. NIES-53]